LNVLQNLVKREKVMKTQARRDEFKGASVMWGGDHKDPKGYKDRVKMNQLMRSAAQR
jgi:hypothetical protein